MEKNRARILLVDDDEFIRKTIRMFLEQEGYIVDVAEDGRAMTRHFATSVPDLILLDMVLPDEDGLTLIQRVRRDFPELPVIFLSGKGDVMDKVLGLEMGANDYVTKPYNSRELLARIRALLRERGSVRETRSRNYSFGPFVLDSEAFALRHADSGNIPITSREFRLLKILVDNPGRVLSRDRLLDLLAGRDWEPSDRSIDVLVGRLRRKLVEHGASTEIIKALRGEGYVFTRPA